MQIWNYFCVFKSREKKINDKHNLLKYKCRLGGALKVNTMT